MAPPLGQSGPGKKNAGVPKQSRNSTPAPALASLPPQESYDPDFLDTRVILFPNLKFEDLVDHGASNAMVPESRSVEGMLERFKSLTSIMEKRSNFYDRGMRYLAAERKKRPEDYEVPELESKRTKLKRKKASESLAPGDAAGHDQSSPLRDARRKHSRDGSASSSLSPVTAATPSAMEAEKKKAKKVEKEQESSSEDEGAPPRREAPQSQTFGEDPSIFPDPTIYEIRDIQPGMTDEEKKAIYSVASYPRSDLADLIAGDPPDNDFSSAKPTSQINFTTFSSYIEPYFRPYTEEDLAFLRERGDRVTPFAIPKRGKRHYTEIWAEEDGAMSIDSPQQGRDRPPPNQARGSIDNMSDSVAETDKLSMGPLASRLLQMMRVENRAPPAEDRPGSNGATTNGDTSFNGEMNSGGGGDDQVNGDVRGQQLPPATCMPESSTEAWKKAVHPKLDYSQVDERLKQELRHIGFLPQEEIEMDYDGHFDDEIAARLRLLQDRLREQVLINGARKTRLMELVRERMSHQEYQTILEDLDSQVQAAYLKRTRTMGKSKKAKRPGGVGGGSHAAGGGAGSGGASSAAAAAAAAAAGTARPGIGDMTRTLMERRRRWIDTIGSVFDDEGMNRVPRAADPDSTIFKEAMAALVKAEKEAWDDEVEEE